MMPRMIACSARAVLLLCALLLAGCATPVGVTMVSPREAYQDAYANPLGAGVLSDQAKYVLNRYNLLKEFAHAPDAAIAALHRKALNDDRRDILYALSEMSYVYGEQLAKSARQEDQRLAPDYFLLSVLYAYYFAGAERSDPPPTAFDQRFRNACDLYNFGLWRALATAEGQGLVLEGKTRKLPLLLGQLSISLNAAQLPWKLEDFEKFEPADKYAVRGISVRNRNPGVGLPLIGIKKASGSAPSQAVPVTAFLRIQGDLASLSSGKATAVLELYTALDTSTVLVNNREVPLEIDTTTPLAYQLEGSEVWGFGLSGFLGKEINKSPDGLYLREPYRAGRIPVVFVHGTASSPVWWAEMFNTLGSDPLIRQKYQFWFFMYTSSKPVVYSAADLRDALRDKLANLDPEGRDEALQQMVVIGHSQGGLLTKLTAVDTGDKLLRSLTGQDLDSMKMSDEGKAKLRRLLYVKPLSFVKEVIFISTPHRGSFRSTTWARDLARRFVTLPATLVQSSMEHYDYMTDDVKKLIGGKKKILTSADGMSPDSPLLEALAQIPLAPGVKGHSIIAVKDEGDPKLGDDGVVKYTSAHLDGMESEFVVISDHSAQLNPLAIDEVRRILVEHLTASSRDTVNRK